MKTGHNYHLPESETPSPGTVMYYRGKLNEAPEEVPGTLALLSVFVDEMAEVEWDRFMEEFMMSASLEEGAVKGIGVNLRFVEVEGVWRAFNDSYGGFVAQWDYTAKRWTTKRTPATRTVTVFVGGRELPLKARIPTSGDVLKPGDEDVVKLGDIVLSERETVRAGLCLRCGSEEGLLCAC